MSQSKKLDFLLIGKTGNGKSATGNSILLHKVFKSHSSASSVTNAIKQGFGKHKGRVIRVVDSPGVGETRLDTAKAILMVSKALKKAILRQYPKGYHAFLILIKYGNRFTGEEQDAIKFLKDTFGANFVQDFCIVVMCGGDNFKHEYEETTDMTFKKWVEEQKGQMRDLILECGGRILLFDNATKDEQEKKEQLDKLIEIVDNLSAGGKRYTDKHFEEAKETRDIILEEANENIISEEILMEINLIFQKLEKIRNGLHRKPPNQKLEKLKTRCQEVIKEIKTKTTTSVMKSLLESITSLNRIIDLEIQYNEKIEKKRTEHSNAKDILKKRHEEETEQISTEFTKILTEITQGVGEKKEKKLKQQFKKEFEEYKSQIQRGCTKESVKQIIERMKLNILDDVPKQMITKEKRIESNQETCSLREEMTPQIQQVFTGESAKEKKEPNESNTVFSGVQKLTKANEKSIETKKQSCLQHEEVARKIKQPAEPTSKGVFEKNKPFFLHLEDVLTRQAQEDKERKMDKKTQKKEETDERQKLMKETQQVEDMYRAVEDKNNDSLFSKVMKWIGSLFKK